MRRRKKIMVIQKKRTMKIKRKRARMMKRVLITNTSSQLSVLMDQKTVLKEQHSFQMHVLAI